MKINLLLSSVISNWPIYPWSKANYTDWTLCHFDGVPHFVKLTKHKQYFSHRFDGFEDLSTQGTSDVIITSLKYLPKSKNIRYTIINPIDFLLISTREQEKYPIETCESRKK